MLAPVAMTAPASALVPPPAPVPFQLSGRRWASPRRRCHGMGLAPVAAAGVSGTLDVTAAASTLERRRRRRITVGWWRRLGCVLVAAAGAGAPFEVTAAVPGVATALLEMAATSAPSRLREEMLCKARARLNQYSEGWLSLQPSRKKDGVVICRSQKGPTCGGDNVPVTFGEFDVEGAHPVEVFRVLAGDGRGRPAWNPAITGWSAIGDFPELGVRGFREIYPSGVPFVADREIHQWVAFDESKSVADEDTEYWLVVSTERNDELKRRLPLASWDVEAQNCLGAYRMVPTASGSHVFFTQQVNPHAWPVPDSVVWEMSWQKQVDFINALRHEVTARRAAAGAGVDATGVAASAAAFVPAELLLDSPAASPTSCPCGGDGGGAATPRSPGAPGLPAPRLFEGTPQNGPQASALRSLPSEAPQGAPAEALLSAAAHAGFAVLAIAAGLIAARVALRGVSGWRQPRVQRPISAAAAASNAGEEGRATDEAAELLGL